MFKSTLNFFVYEMCSTGNFPCLFFSNKKSVLTFTPGPFRRMWILDSHCCCIFVLQAQTEGGEVGSLHLFCRHSFTQCLVTQKLWWMFWRMMIHLSATGETWHLELKTRWNICFWYAHRRRTRCIWFHHLLVWHSDLLFTVSAGPSGHTELYSKRGRKKFHQSRERHYAGWWTSFTTFLYFFTLWKCEHF